jgi:hypothetical protein
VKSFEQFIPAIPVQQLLERLAQLVESYYGPS